MSMMPMRRVRQGVGGRGISSSSSSPPPGTPNSNANGSSGQRSSRITMMTRGGAVAVHEDDHDDKKNDDGACDGSSWAWSDDDAASSVGGASAAKIMSLSEKLRRHELLEQQQQQQQQHLQSRRERGGPMSDADHSVGRKSLLANNPPTTTSAATRYYFSSSGDSVDSDGWSWPSNASTTSRNNNNNNTNGSNENATKLTPSIHGNKRNLPGRQYLYNKYSKRGMFANSVYYAFGGKRNSHLTTRIVSAMNCTKPSQHDDDDDDDDDIDVGVGDTHRDGKHTQPFSKRFGIMAKMGLMLLLMIGSVSRLAGRYHNILESSSSIRNNMPSSSSSMSMNNMYLRGQQQQPSHYAHGESQADSILSTNLSHAVLLPAHLLSHLSDITLPYYHTSSSSSSSSKNKNHSTFTNKTGYSDTPYFWDVHFSGESVAEYIFSACHGLIQACELGIRQPDFAENKLETFHLDGATYVNVDTTTKEGILRAYQLGLAQSHLADVIISPHFHYMTSHIFSSDNPGRMFALFRHPVDRAVSMYYYLAKATWDPHYNPDLATMTLEQYAKSRYIENNWLTRFLVNKLGGTLSRADVLLAKEIIGTKCLVGLYDDMEVSMARFQRYFGWNAEETDENKKNIAQCRMNAVRRGDKHVVGHPVSVIKDVVNTNANMTSSSSPVMPVVRPGSIAWNAIVRMNTFDMELYEFVEKIYRSQGEEIFDVVGYEVPLAAAVRGGNVGEESRHERLVLPDDPFEASISTDDNPGKTMPF